MRESVVAVLGTLAGGAMTFGYQAWLARSARRHAVEDKRHTELLTACAALGTAMLAYRHSQLARQTYRLRNGAGTLDLAVEVRQKRGDSWAALFKVELLTTDQDVLRAARRAMTLIRGLKTVQDLGQLDADAEVARVSIHEFIKCARDRLLLPGA